MRTPDEADLGDDGGDLAHDEGTAPIAEQIQLVPNVVVERHKRVQPLVVRGRS